MTQKDNICSGSQEYVSILHLDRLRITLKHLDTSTFKNYYNPDIIPEEQIYGKIRLLLDNTRGAGAYYHTFLVFYQGIRVGKLHTANKRRKPDLEFDFDKQTLYAVDETWWHQILETLKAELGLGYNNINYAEIALDTTKNLIKEFRSNFSDTESNKAGVNSYFKLRKGTKVDVLDNG